MHGTRRGLRIACAILSACLVAMLAGFCALVRYATEQGAEQAVADEAVTMTVSDKPAPVAPIWLQDDQSWGDQPYGGGTLSNAGCGLTSCAIAVSYLTGEDWNPSRLHAEVGDTCLTDGLNDMEKFGIWAHGRWPQLVETERYNDLSRAIEETRHGSVVFASLTGTFGERDYGGHVILIWRVDDDGAIEIRDPKSMANSTRRWSADELSTVDWAYFYGIKNQQI